MRRTVRKGRSCGLCCVICIIDFLKALYDCTENLSNSPFVQLACMLQFIYGSTCLNYCFFALTARLWHSLFRYSRKPCAYFCPVIDWLYYFAWEPCKLTIFFICNSTLVAFCPNGVIKSKCKMLWEALRVQLGREVIQDFAGGNECFWFH